MTVDELGGTLTHGEEVRAHGVETLVAQPDSVQTPRSLQEGNPAVPFR